ncbi:N(4)-(beta-N-acetylglucosaminyl)-L-asparaginase [Kordia sp. SMS9]|uniref:N(4)-(beta-N-acetylglucosaminyl)-L-asparaginase n=1 Tax=Kordia sp. SMS9 TaxID=2282170 RepID=UPI000E0D62A5|nr:N(4)-(beta-N-acetylglucosaminyl)-L-asparaginase [Kordia sp. SMS9]AXG70955.1 N(4)-(beta-N-acetylglucosaminyl)-L-asparaginase [Kordia sp. SMS9]
MKRRKFIQNAALTGLGLTVGAALTACADDEKSKEKAAATKFTSDVKPSIPMVIATWNVPNATKKAWEVIEAGNSALDAVEKGVMVEEADVNNQSVGKGGLPDRDGNVTLDACIMNKDGDYGAVVCIENIKHPISVARKVMEDTPHVLLAGNGAKKFAIESGFTPENLLTEASKKAWEKWKVEAKYKPIINVENHDTIGMLAIDKKGNISGACTTSGLSYKMQGRVGDSAIIGSGLFIDNEVGGATATGMGEEVLKTVGSFLIVELMRQGKSPQEACEEAVKRVIKKSPNYKDFQVGYIAVNKKGETGAYCIHEWFNYTTYQNGENVNHKSDFYNKQ